MLRIFLTLMLEVASPPLSVRGIFRFGEVEERPEPEPIALVTGVHSRLNTQRFRPSTFHEPAERIRSSSVVVDYAVCKTKLPLSL